MRQSSLLYLGVIVLMAPHVTVWVAVVLAGLLLLAAAVLQWLGD